jgi:hypothetical protein
MYIQTTFVVFKISMFIEQVGIIMSSMEHHGYCFSYVTFITLKCITIRKYDIILRNNFMNSLYVTDCWKNVDLTLLIELKEIVTQP